MNCRFQAAEWIFRAAAFLAACLAACAALRWLMLQYDWVSSWPIAVASVNWGGGFAWLAFRCWWRAHPLRGAVAMGLCSGLAGSGAYSLGMAFLLPPIFTMGTAG